MFSTNFSFNFALQYRVREEIISKKLDVHSVTAYVKANDKAMEHIEVLAAFTLSNQKHFLLFLLLSSYSFFSQGLAIFPLCILWLGLTSLCVVFLCQQNLHKDVEKTNNETAKLLKRVSVSADVRFFQFFLENNDSTLNVLSLLFFSSANHAGRNRKHFGKIAVELQFSFNGTFG